MSTTATPPPVPDLSGAYRAIGAIGRHITALAALGALLGNDHAKARAALERLPASYLDQLAPAAAQLAEFARLVASLEDRT